MWDTFKFTCVCIVEVFEGEEKEKEAGKMFEEIAAKNFSNLLKNFDLHTQEAQRTSSRINAKRSTNRHIMIKVLKAKDKENTLKTREK